ncbi:hypothetical protein RA26_02215 [Leisingera sp. ANG-M7]|nr:hypothetical protein RA26_02215 [Leisingera sp. ANG-M7]
MGDYAQTSLNEVLAQYRFMGLICGIKGPNDSDADVTRARDALMEALSGFLELKDGPFDAEAAQSWQEYRSLRDAPDLFENFDPDEALLISDAVNRISMGHPADTGSYLPEIAEGSRTPDTSGYLASGDLSPAGQAHIDRAAAAYRRAAEFELLRRNLAAERRRQWWNGVWDKIRSYYDETMTLIDRGQWLMAYGRIQIDAAVFAAEEAIVGAIVAAIIAISGGVAAVVALALRSAVRAAISIVRLGSRTVRKVRATWDFKIELRKVEPGILYSNPMPLDVKVTRKLDYEHTVHVDRDLTPDEARAMGEGGQGSTRPDTDAPEPGSSGGSDGTSAAPAEGAFRHPREGQPPRSNEELAPGGRVPGSKRNLAAFQTWWDDLSPAELEQLFKDDDILSTINRRIRGGGEEHEWLKVSQQLAHKRLGFSMKEIQQWVTATKDAQGPLPQPTAAGHTRWRHAPEGGGKGSGPGSKTMHNALDELYRPPPPKTRTDLLRRMGYFANHYLDGGVNGLPAGLREAILNVGDG